MTDPALSPRERVVRRVLVAALALGIVVLLVVGHAARQAERADSAAKAATATARTSVPAILSYTDSNLAPQLAASRRLMTPTYARRYAAMVQKRVWPEARRFAVSNQVAVVSVGTVRTTPTTAVVLVFANQTTRTKSKPEGVTQGARLEVRLRLLDKKWLVADVRPL